MWHCQNHFISPLHCTYLCILFAYLHEDCLYSCNCHIPILTLWAPQAAEGHRYILVVMQGYSDAKLLCCVHDDAQTRPLLCESTACHSFPNVAVSFPIYISDLYSGWPPAVVYGICQFHLYLQQNEDININKSQFLVSCSDVLCVSHYPTHT